MAQRPDLTGVPPWGHSVFNGMDQLDTRVSRVQTTVAGHHGVLDTHRNKLVALGDRVARLEQGGMSVGDTAHLHTALSYIALLERNGAPTASVEDAARLQLEQFAPEFKRIEDKADLALRQIADLQQVVFGVQGPAIVQARDTADTALQTARQALECAQGADERSAEAFAMASASNSTDDLSSGVKAAFLVVGLAIFLILLNVEKWDTRWWVKLGAAIAAVGVAIFIADNRRNSSASASAGGWSFVSRTRPAPATPSPTPAPATVPATPVTRVTTPPPLTTQVVPAVNHQAAPAATGAAAAARASTY